MCVKPTEVLQFCATGCEVVQQAAQVLREGNSGPHKTKGARACGEDHKIYLQIGFLSPLTGNWTPQQQEPVFSVTPFVFSCCVTAGVHHQGGPHIQPGPVHRLHLQLQHGTHQESVGRRGSRDAALSLHVPRPRRHHCGFERSVSSAHSDLKVFLMEL